MVTRQQPVIQLELRVVKDPVISLPVALQLVDFVPIQGIDESKNQRTLYTLCHKNQLQLDALNLTKTWLYRAKGKLTKKVVPLPTSLSTQIFPPMAST